VHINQNQRRPSNHAMRILSNIPREDQAKILLSYSV